MAAPQKGMAPLETKPISQAAPAVVLGMGQASFVTRGGSHLAMGHFCRPRDNSVT